MASTAFTVAAVLADQAALLIDEVGRAALLAFLTGLVLGAVGDVLFQGAFYAVLPGVDALVVEVEALDEVEDVHDGHAVADDARDELGVVPELLTEHVGYTSEDSGIAVAVGVVEVVAAGALLGLFLDDTAGGDGRRQVAGVVHHTGEDLVGLAVLLADEGDPLLVAVLEADDVGLEGLGSLLGLDDSGSVLGRYQHSCTEPSR